MRVLHSCSEYPACEHDGEGCEGDGGDVGGEEVGAVTTLLLAVLPALHQDATSELLVLAPAGIVALEFYKLIKDELGGRKTKKFEGGGKL